MDNIDKKFPLAKEISMRDVGLDEYWLQRQIFDDPACLGLGELDAVDKERSQSSGGRLDILLKDPADAAMYEVEVMLGETDESHIIRTIEYWDNERRRWPQRQHFAVLVAERINRRFFNVIHLLSHSIPIVAIQATLFKSGDQKFLSFIKILDTYEEIDDGASIEVQTYNRQFWESEAKWTLDAADELLKVAEKVNPDVTLTYLKNYVALSGRRNYVWLHKRTNGKSLVKFRLSDLYWQAVQELLNKVNIVPSYSSRDSSFMMLLDPEHIKDKNETLEKVLEYVVKP